MARRPMFTISTPSTAIFVISLVLGIGALLSRFGQASLPFISGHEFASMAIAWGLLSAGVALRGI